MSLIEQVGMNNDKSVKIIIDLSLTPFEPEKKLRQTAKLILTRALNLPA